MNSYLSVGPHNTTTMKTYIGLNSHQFQQILNMVNPSLLPIFKSPIKPRNALYIFLMKLRTGHTLEQIAPHFNVSPMTISSWIRAVRNIVHSELVRVHLYERKREDLILNTTPLSRKLYQAAENCCVVTIDATYVFTIKSSNYAFQKKSYSGQFRRNLVKFMLFVSTNGLIAASYGPFDATKNDAKILEQILNDDRTIFGTLLPGDVLVVDRGFRDCIRALKARRFVVQVPKGTKKKTSNPLRKLDANESRFATKTRFVVEVRNSHIKNTWKQLSGTKIYQYIPHLKKDFEICAALVNAFCQKIISDKDDWENIGDLMLDKLGKSNPLPTIVSRIPNDAFQNVQNLTLFPKFSYRDLKKISQGSYQIRQAPNYCQCHVKENNNTFVTKVCDSNICLRLCGALLDNTTNPLLLSIDLKSRFETNKFHKVYILLSLNSDEKYVLSGYFCSCKHGRRTVGCCSHVMLLLWYTLYVDPNKMRSLFPSSNLNNMFDKWNEEYSDSTMD